MRFKKYIVLEEKVPIKDQEALERSIVAVLPVVLPAEDFVMELGRSLLVEAKQQRGRAWHVRDVWRIVGIVAGSVLYVAGGVMVWLLWRRKAQVPATALPSS